MTGSVSGRVETLTDVHSTLRDSFLTSDIAENHQILTLAAVLDDERKSTSDNTVVRTLFDIIRADETPSSHSTSKNLSSKKTWKLFRERLKLRRNNASNSNPNSLRSVRRANSFGAESSPVDARAVLGDGDQIQRSSSMRLSAALAAEREMMSVSVEPEPAQEPVRMSLMEMLEEQAGIQEVEDQSDEDEDGGTLVMEEEEEKGGGGGALVVEMVCCVCMIRHKGAAFIPCGHTFCRMCSRELWVQRGNCPLCNNSILEILDIF